ncbi:MAG: biotin transporter BioY, partial [Firmicutes bacterium]|nr:biotin transporter BioY [Bacillota bacterium]
MNKKIVGLTFTAIFAALLSILSVVSVPIGPVPITMSLLAIFIISMILRPKYSVTATLVYITLGAIGLP